MMQLKQERRCQGLSKYGSFVQWVRVCLIGYNYRIHEKANGGKPSALGKTVEDSGVSRNNFGY